MNLFDRVRAMSPALRSTRMARKYWFNKELVSKEGIQRSLEIRTNASYYQEQNQEAQELVNGFLLLTKKDLENE